MMSCNFGHETDVIKGRFISFSTGVNTEEHSYIYLQKEKILSLKTNNFTSCVISFRDFLFFDMESYNSTFKTFPNSLTGNACLLHDRPMFFLFPSKVFFGKIVIMNLKSCVNMRFTKCFLNIWSQFLFDFHLYIVIQDKGPSILVRLKLWMCQWGVDPN